MNNKTRHKMTGFELYKKYGILAVLAAEMVLFGILAPNFMNLNNILEILRQVSFQGILAVGMTFCMLTGGVDLSVGSLTAFCGTIGAMVMAATPIPYAEGGFNPNPIVGVLTALLSGLAWGLINGFLINKIKITPLVATLATYESIRGLVYIMTGAIPIYKGIEPYFRVLGTGSVWIIPVPVIIMALVFIIGGIILAKTVYGRSVYCVGGSEEVARLSGINVKRIKYSVYAISGVLCGLTGMMLVARMNSAQPNMGLGYEFEVITACVLGGVSMAGGEGKMLGAFTGILIMGILLNGLIQVGLNDFYREVFSGVVLVIAVGIDALSRNKKPKLSDLIKQEKLEKSTGNNL